MVVPIFRDFVNVVDFVPQGDIFKRNWQQFARVGYDYYKGFRPLSTSARIFGDLLVNSKIRFRGIYLNRQGEFLWKTDFPGVYGPGDLFRVDVNEEWKKTGRELTDALMILVASRGRPDRWLSSPGSVTVRYSNEKVIGGYRTGFFARPLNSGKQHFGFTGINVQVSLQDGLIPSMFLINHASDASYDRAVEPLTRLYRPDGEFLEAPYGRIEPHGALERSVYDLFPNAQEFLASAQGWGCAITQVKGSTLASIHILRSHDGSTLAMDHSRPLHTNVVG